MQILINLKSIPEPVSTPSYGSKMMGRWERVESFTRLFPQLEARTSNIIRLWLNGATGAFQKRSGSNPPRIMRGGYYDGEARAAFDDSIDDADAGFVTMCT